MHVDAMDTHSGPASATRRGASTLGSRFANGHRLEANLPRRSQAMSYPLPDESVHKLRDLVRRHRVTWESRPELADCNGELMPIGFTVELSAIHDHPAHPPFPGCPECAPVRTALRRICMSVLPRGDHASWYDVHVGTAFESDPRRGEFPQLSATIEILHCGTVNRPSDDCERACFDEIQGRLIELGAQHGTWVETRAADTAS
jgi:hypothetical protein